MSSAPAGTPRPARRLPLLWRGPLLDPSGYADEGRGFLLALERASYEAAAEDLHWNNVRAELSPAQHQAVARALSRRAPAGEYALVRHHQPWTENRLHEAG